MDEKQSSLSDDVIIEIVHSIKDIVIELIDRAFPKKENKQEERMKRSEIAEFIESMEEISENWTEEKHTDVRKIRMITGIEACRELELYGE